MSAKTWHNQLPAWIVADLEQRPLRQGPLATLQVVANHCDAPPCIGSGALLVCFGGDKLIDACRCSNATFWIHLQTLVRRGYVVPLSRGGGRIANAYGIPGQTGELDAHRVASDAKPRWWCSTDTAKIRQLLVSENEALASREPGNDQLSQNKTPAVRKQDGCRPETGRVPSENKALPSPIPSSSTSAHKPSPAAGLNQLASLHDDDDSDCPEDTAESVLASRLTDTASNDQIKAVLVEYGVDAGRAHNLAAAATPAAVREVLACAIPRLPGVANRGGYIGEMTKNAIERDRKVRAQQHADQWEKREMDTQAAHEQRGKMSEADFIATLHQCAKESPNADVAKIVQTYLDGNDPIAARRDKVVIRYLAEHVLRVQDNAT